MSRYVIHLTIPLFLISCNNLWVEKLSQLDQLKEMQFESYDSGFATIAARPEYDKGELHQFFFGGQYRDLWSTPVTVEKINIAEEGFIILKKGGGRQSVNLRLLDEEENQYVLRSVDKNAVQLPKILHRTFVGTLVKDQVSSGHPYGSLTLPLMSEALNIFHTNPKLRLIPDDPSLGEYYKNFAGMMVIMEHRPDENQTAFDYLGNSENVIGSKNFLTDIFKENDSQVDRYHFLRTRMFDMLVGDWSRHEDNWRWATYEQDKGTFYKAIPRDRDHVFYYMDGILSRSFRAVAKPHFRSFRKNFKGIIRLNTSGESLDRLLLWSLEAEDWKNTADTVRFLLTDEVIDEAMKSLPYEIYEKNGEWLAERLKTRRDILPEKIHRYYLYLAKKPTVYGTDKHEKFVFTITGKDLQLHIFKTDKDGEERKLLYTRLFRSSETKKITLYGLAGNDSFVFRGSGNTPIKLKIFGGAGEDIYVQEIKNKLVRTQIIDTEEGNTYAVKKGFDIRRKQKPRAQNFDANGALLTYYIWD